MNLDYWLIKKIKNGDKDACEEFVKRYYEAILFYCLKRLSDEELAKDITQDTFLKFFEHIFDFNFQNKTKNYLYTIAGNLIKNEYKKSKNISWEQHIELVEQITDLKDDYKKITDKTDLDILLKKIPEEYSECLILFYVHEYKQKEISEMLNISLPLVKYRIKKGKEIMRSVIKESSLYE